MHTLTSVSCNNAVLSQFILVFLLKIDVIIFILTTGDRQLKVYGTRSPNGSVASSSPPRSPMHPSRSPMMQQQRPAAATAETEDGTSQQQQQQTQHSYNPPGTPQNTPAYNNNDMNGSPENSPNNNNGVLLCPRGLAAIPLLCAAAAESRSAYLARLQVTHPSNGVRRITRVCVVSNVSASIMF